MFTDISQEISKQLADLTYQAQEGNESALKISAILKKVESVASDLRKSIESHAIDEADTYDKKEEIVMAGCKIECRSRTSPQYNEDSEYKRLGLLQKNRKDMLKKAIGFDGELYDENGEIIPKVEVKTSTYLTFSIQ